MKTKNISLGLIGAGRIGTFHAETIVYRVPNATLVSIADPAEGVAAALAARLGVEKSTSNISTLINDPDLQGVIIASPARFHTDLVIQACEAGKHVFVEKPMALTIENAKRAIDAAENAGVTLQVGFNRRWDQAFAEGRSAIAAGKIGAPQLLRSLTRDPGPFCADPAKIPQWTIFYETLIHDFDTLNWLNNGSKPVEVYATADALVAPEAKSSGYLDTAVVTIKYDNGAIAVAEANFSALYGYDIRGEVFGSEGMVTMGEMARSSMSLYSASGVAQDTLRKDTERFMWPYAAEFQGFVDAIAGERIEAPTGEDAKMALAIALAAIESVKSNAPVSIASVAQT
ncbi:Gfo/Idh/MocA family oxidoreductase [Roseinatronobacter alkalisoli]|uniref:Gfo/Idh/MocA family oxidoreductase n=1 Tax=Roseinatronobacter alkalisoli TaxID=3028235 RepID=A0ABT5TEQ4_9RHOB|nr:Gfo/Idh/MocA family oxidoreductase [Roseinatronobacter sp. HJB301]MDD7973604.1 Gfo/Idh/MocA family oxidoreductase [Roseinatronobacter sp. HJB301]